jgi:nucleotide-binding universal stress UspA family protein
MRVLLAVDEDSVLDDVVEALRWCVRLRAGDDVTVLHVSPAFGWMARGHGVEGCAEEALKEAQDQKAERVLSAARRLLESWNACLEYRHEQGHPATEILRMAQQRRVDLIVIGARGTEERGLLVGSTTQRVKALAHADVLVVRRGRPPDGHPFRAVLAVDGSAESTGAVESFARFMQADRADVRLVHAVDLPPTVWDLCGPHEPLDVASLRGPVREQVDGALAGALGVLRAHGIAATTEVRQGRAAAGILTAAMACRAHLAVVGSRGLSGIRGLLLGSAAQRVVRHGTCSVLIGRRSPFAHPLVGAVERGLGDRLAMRAAGAPPR